MFMDKKIFMLSNNIVKLDKDFYRSLQVNAN